MKLRVFCICTIFVLICSTVFAQDNYVSLTGEDNKFNDIPVEVTGVPYDFQYSV